MQYSNELLNNMFNIVRQQNSHTLEVRFQRLEESIHNTSSRINIIQEVAPGNTHATVPELAEEKRDEAPQSKVQGKTKKPQTPVESPRRDYGNHASSSAQEKKSLRNGATETPVIYKNLGEQDF